MDARRKSATLFASNTGSATGLAASTNPLLNHHFPRTSAEFDQSLKDVLYPYNLSPACQAHLEIVKVAIELDNDTALNSIGLSADNQHLAFTFIVSALSQALMPSTKLEKIAGCKHTDLNHRQIGHGSLQSVSLLYPKETVPHFLEWLDNHVKALDEDRLASARQLSERDEDLKNRKPSFVNRISSKMIKLERQLIVAGGQEVLIGQLLAAHTILVPALKNQEWREAHEVTDTDGAGLKKLLSTFQHSIDIIFSEQALKTNVIAQQILTDVSAHLNALQLDASKTSDVLRQSPKMI